MDSRDSVTDVYSRKKSLVTNTSLSEHSPVLASVAPVVNLPRRRCSRIVEAFSIKDSSVAAVATNSVRI
jgi:hypothetical protein